ncbi:MAG: right-handed parallel beta-helix repeat-containing protein [Candidatus Hydrogenedentota bacterium]
MNKRAKVMQAVVAGLCMVLGLSVGAQVHVVPGGAGDEDGSDWDNAFASLQDAVDAAADDGGEVWVAEGTYELSEPVSWPGDVEGYGGFPVGGDFDARDPWANPTVLEGADIGDPGDLSEHAEGAVIFFSGEDSTGNRLDGFRIENAGSNRGAVLVAAEDSVENVEATVAQCHFVNNEADMGAAITADNTATLHVEDCIFEDNSTGNLGGAILYRFETSGSITNSIFMNNTSGDGGGGGSAIFTDTSGITVDYSTFTGNVVDGENGYVIRGGFEVAESIIFGNDPNDVEESDDITNSIHETDIDEDPLFVDAEAGDLRLGAGSPAIGAADDDGNLGARDLPGTGLSPIEVAPDTRVFVEPEGSTQLGPVLLREEFEEDATFQWLFEGEELEDETGDGLSIDEATVEQAGTYTVMVDHPDLDAPQEFDIELRVEEVQAPAAGLLGLTAAGGAIALAGWARTRRKRQ